MGNPICCLVWFVILIFLSFFVAGFCAPFYILFYAFEACISACKGINEVLLKGVQFPNFCAKKMVKCEGC